jgi:hypothetical protein
MKLKDGSPMRGLVGAAAVLLGSVPAWGLTPVMLHDFEAAAAPPKIWVVNVPNENAVAQLSTDDPHDGKQCLKLHYTFVESGGFQYLGVPLGVKVKAPVHALRYWLRGDNSRCSYGVQVLDVGGETHQFAKQDGRNRIIDFTGWREVVVDLDAPHETWGGDKNGKLDYPLSGITLTVGQPTEGDKRMGISSDLSFDGIGADSERTADETLGSQVGVVSPAYCSEVEGDTTVEVSAPGFTNVTAHCWKQGAGFGSGATVASVALDGKGRGAFVFPADQYPHGPVTLRISGTNSVAGDNCYLQLYNKGGVSWNEGLPKDPPPGASGMKLLFADDFTGPLSIGPDPKATYYDHKPPTGGEDFSFPMRFRNFDSPENPFAQVGTYLRIRADAKKESAGLISSLHGDGSGVKASVPCYFECRFIGPNATGTWPAFWLMNDNFAPPATKLTDELDIIEAYGGEGPRQPNAYDKYVITPHVWNYPPDEEAPAKAMLKKEWPYPYLVSMSKLGIPSTWYESPHTYGCKVTATETTYYCDNIEIGHHQTLPMCKQRPLYFMVNLATGGGWPVDLSRYDGVADMYVDFVRVYQGE